MFRKDHALSEKAIKKLGLENAHEDYELTDQTPVKEWDSSEAYWNEWMGEIEAKDAMWYNKIKNFFKYRICWRTREWWYDIKWYFRNLRRFQPILKEWRSFSYQYQVDLFKFGIKQLAEALDYYGHEVEESRNKRVKAMRELIKEIERDYEEELREKMKYNFHDRKEKVIKYADGSVSFESFPTEEEKKRTEEYYKSLAQERINHYNRIFHLILGQEEEAIAKEVEARIAAMSEDEKKAMPESELYRKVYNEVWDGSGIEGWWD